MKTANLKIRAITDEAAAEELEKTLVANRAVRTASVRPGNPAGAEVQYDETRVTPEHLVGILRKRGYDAEIGGYTAGGAP